MLIEKRFQQVRSGGHDCKWSAHLHVHIYTHVHHLCLEAGESRWRIYHNFSRWKANGIKSLHEKQAVKLLLNAFAGQDSLAFVLIFLDISMALADNWNENLSAENDVPIEFMISPVPISVF